MDAEFVRGFGQVVGFLAGGGLLTLMFYVGMSWNSVRRDVSETKDTANRTEITVGSHATALQAITMTLHGPLGDNGLYSDVRAIKDQLRESPGAPKRRRTDKRKTA